VRARLGWVLAAVGAAAALGLAVVSMVLPMRVSVPGGTYSCGRPYQRYDDAGVKLNWVGESLIVKSKHLDVPFDALPARTCPDAVDTRVILGGVGGGIAVVLIVAGTLVAGRRRRVGPPDHDDPPPRPPRARGPVSYTHLTLPTKREV
jgi:hypothetical protein